MTLLDPIDRKRRKYQMKKLTNGKIVALCMGDFARGMINGIITTYLLTFFIPTNANTTSWISSVVLELRDMGFNEVLLTDFRFPNSDRKSVV